MSKKHKRGPAPVPKGNLSQFTPGQPMPLNTPSPQRGAPLSEHDPKRRLGGYESAGEHSIEQPGGKQGANR